MSQIFPKATYAQRRSQTYQELTEPHLKLQVPPSPKIGPKRKQQSTTEFTFKLPLPCQGTGAVSHFNLPCNSTQQSAQEQTRQNYKIRNDFFERRPDLEDMLLDALELSMSEDQNPMPLPAGYQKPSIMERQTLKKQISETIRKSQQQLQSMVFGEATKRSHVEIDSAVFSAQPILSVLQHAKHAKLPKYTPNYAARARYSCPIPTEKMLPAQRDEPAFGEGIEALRSKPSGERMSDIKPATANAQRFAI